LGGAPMILADMAVDPKDTKLHTTAIRPEVGA
jgi:hypothetical protein